MVVYRSPLVLSGGWIHLPYVRLWISTYMYLIRHNKKMHTENITQIHKFTEYKCTYDMGFNNTYNWVILLSTLIQGGRGLWIVSNAGDLSFLKTFFHILVKNFRFFY